MKRSRIVALGASLGVFMVAGVAGADHVVRARLGGFDEVPSVSTTGEGRFRAWLRRNAIEFELSYEDLEGDSSMGAHIHLGQRHTNGGVAAFLCGGGGLDPCPNGSGRVHGMITADDVFGPEGQGIAPGGLEELMKAMRAGATYVNVHTNKHPGGEIPGQVDDD